MTTIEILENNKLIAEFMGWKVQLDTTEEPNYYRFYKPNEQKYSALYFNFDNIVHGTCMETVGWNLISEYTKYDCSWDSLMPVLHKCLKINITCKTNNLKYILSINDFTNIEYLYKEIVEFIKWYNQNK